MRGGASLPPTCVRATNILLRTFMASCFFSFFSIKTRISNLLVTFKYKVMCVACCGEVQSDLGVLSRKANRCVQLTLAFSCHLCLPLSSVIYSRSPTFYLFIFLHSTQSMVGKIKYAQQSNKVEASLVHVCARLCGSLLEDQTPRWSRFQVRTGGGGWWWYKNKIEI